MKMLLIGEYYSSNLGDPILCQVVENIIRSEYREIEIIPMDISGRTNYNLFYSPTSYSSRQLWYFRLSHRAPWFCRQFPLLRIYETDPGRHMRVISMLSELLSKHSFDIAVFAGGSLFMDYFAAVIHDIVSTLSKKNIPVIFHACGMSRLTLDTSKILHRAIHYPNVKWVALRDSYDLFVKQFAPRCPTVETYDTALLCSQFYPQSITKKYDYGIGLMSITESTSFQKELLKWVSNSGRTWCIFTNGSYADHSFAQNLIKEMNISPDHLIARPELPQDLVYAISCCKQILSFRMHSQIVASSLGIPCFGFAWDQKITEFFNKLGFSENCCVPSNSWSLSSLSRLDALDSNDLHSAALEQGKISKDCLLEGISWGLHHK